MAVTPARRYISGQPAAWQAVFIACLPSGWSGGTPSAMQREMKSESAGRLRISFPAYPPADTKTSLASTQARMKARSRACQQAGWPAPLYLALAVHTERARESRRQRHPHRPRRRPYRHQRRHRGGLPANRISEMYSASCQEHAEIRKRQRPQGVRERPPQDIRRTRRRTCPWRA